MTGPRKPRPKQALTLVEMVADLDRRMEGGDPEAEVLLPAEEWEAIKRQAKEEEPSWSDLDPAEVEAAAREVAAFLSVLRWELVHAKVHGEFRRAAAWLEKLDALKENRITKGVTTQGECERVWRELGMEDLGAEAEPAEPPTKKQKAKAGKPCPHCDETGHEPDACGLKPATEEELAEAAEPPLSSTEVDALLKNPLGRHAEPTSRAEKCASRLSDKKYQAKARKARRDNSSTVCHHCGAGLGEDTGGLGRWSEAHGDVITGTYCTECKRRLSEEAKKSEPAQAEAPF